MKAWSLKLRLSIFATLGISIVLGLAAIGFSWIYRQHVERFVLTELTSHLDQLLAIVEVDDKGVLAVDMQLSDPRFQQPEGGLYWQIDVKGQESLRSRSLWDAKLAIPTPPVTTEEDHAHVIVLPSGGEIFALEKLVSVEGASGRSTPFVVTVGIDRARVTTPVSEFLRAMIVGLALTYLALLASTFSIIALGLRSLLSVKRGLAAMRGGSNKFDAAGLPEEILPLAAEVNALMSAREQQLQRARQRASNLAHGLKTPLAVMLSIANDLRHAKQVEAADAIALNSNQMRDLVERELTRSRMAEGASARQSEILPVLSRVVTTMKKAPRGNALVWNLAVSDGAQMPIDSVDLTELLGNLLDNARKHAVELVRVSFANSTLTVEDDGTGVSEDMLPEIMKRGVRLDEKLPGSGLGLAIVSDLAEVYGLTLNVRRSDLGGLAIDVAVERN